MRKTLIICAVCVAACGEADTIEFPVAGSSGAGTSATGSTGSAGANTTGTTVGDGASGGGGDGTTIVSSTSSGGGGGAPGGGGGGGGGGGDGVCDSEWAFEQMLFFCFVPDPDCCSSFDVAAMQDMCSTKSEGAMPYAYVCYAYSDMPVYLADSDGRKCFEDGNVPLFACPEQENSVLEMTRLLCCEPPLP